MPPKDIKVSKGKHVKRDEDQSIEVEDIDFKEVKKLRNQEEELTEPWYITHF